MFFEPPLPLLAPFLLPPDDGFGGFGGVTFGTAGFTPFGGAGCAIAYFVSLLTGMLKVSWKSGEGAHAKSRDGRSASAARMKRAHIGAATVPPNPVLPLMTTVRSGVYPTHTDVTSCGV